MLKTVAGEAAASEEARRYHPHFVWPFARRMGLGERKISSSNSEPLSDARTMLADVFSILKEEGSDDGKVSRSDVYGRGVPRTDTVLREGV